MNARCSTFEVQTIAVPLLHDPEPIPEDLSEDLSEDCCWMFCNWLHQSSIFTVFGSPTLSPDLVYLCTGADKAEAQALMRRLRQVQCCPELPLIETNVSNLLRQKMGKHRAIQHGVGIGDVQLYLATRDISWHPIAWDLSCCNAQTFQWLRLSPDLPFPYQHFHSPAQAAETARFVNPIALTINTTRPKGS
jgi:hypothetical protein